MINGIKEIYFAPIASGFNVGTFAVHVEFDGNPASASPEKDIADLIETIQNCKMSKNLAVVFLGKFGWDKELMLTLVKTLRDFGYLIEVVTTDMLYHTWYTMVNWLVVQIDRHTAWPGWKCNELIYTIRGGGETDPVVPKDYLNVRLQLTWGGEATMQDFYGFLKRSKYIWNYLPTIKIAQLKVDLGRDK